MINPTNTAQPLPTMANKTPVERMALTVQAYLAQQVDRPVPTDPADIKRELMVMRVSIKNAINNIQDAVEATPSPGVPNPSGQTADAMMEVVRESYLLLIAKAVSNDACLRMLEARFCITPSTP